MKYFLSVLALVSTTAHAETNGQVEQAAWNAVNDLVPVCDRMLQENPPSHAQWVRQRVRDADDARAIILVCTAYRRGFTDRILQEVRK